MQISSLFSKLDQCKPYMSLLVYFVGMWNTVLQKHNRYIIYFVALLCDKNLLSILP